MADGEGRRDGTSFKAEPDEPIRIVVVDDHSLVREGTVDLLEHDPILSVVGQAASGEEAVDLISKLRPDLVIVDIELPGMNGIDLVRAVHRQQRDVRFLVVSAYDDHAYVIEALAAGVLGYLLKTVSGRELINAVHVAAGGSVVLDQNLSRRLTGVQQRSSERPPLDLTPRETDVLALVARGRSNRQIAAELDLGLRTVESHVSNVLAKLGLTSRTEAALYAVRHQLVSSGSPRSST